jgi:hypothetical protein
MSRIRYEDPVEQVMFILGFKYDPKFDTALGATEHGSNPGVLDAADQLRIYGAVEANFHAWRRTIEKLHREFGAELSLSLRGEVYKIVVSELDEGHYGGKWFPASDRPPEYWADLGTYSAIFRRNGAETFCLPTPYFRLLYEFFA